MGTTTFYDVLRFIPGNLLNPPRDKGEWWFTKKGIETLDEAKEWCIPGYRHRILKTVITSETVLDTIDTA